MGKIYKFTRHFSNHLETDVEYYLEDKETAECMQTNWSVQCKLDIEMFWAVDKVETKYECDDNNSKTIIEVTLNKKDKFKIEFIVEEIKVQKHQVKPKSFEAVYS